MRIKNALIILFVLSLFGCSASQWGEGGGSLCDSRMTQLGPDTFMASAIYANGCGSDHKIRHAGVYCSRMGRQILVKNIDNNRVGNVIFQCLIQGDGDLQRPDYEESPDIIIKHK